MIATIKDVSDDGLKRIAIWEEVLEEVCKCYADEVGNRACDWGIMCDRCQVSWVEEIYRGRLEKAGLE